MSTYEIVGVIEKDETQDPVLYKYLVLQVIDEGDDEVLGSGIAESDDAAKEVVAEFIAEALGR